jgi:hypothetical protein
MLFPCFIQGMIVLEGGTYQNPIPAMSDLSYLYDINAISTQSLTMHYVKDAAARIQLL